MTKGKAMPPTSKPRSGAPTAARTTASDEVDEDDEYEVQNNLYEDEGIEGDYEEESEKIRRQLTERPSRSKPICGKALAQSSAETNPSETDDDHPTTATDKLSLRKKTPLDFVKSQIPKPTGSVPKTALPIWYEFSMNEKIPLIPAPSNYLYYTRGKLGQPLHRGHPFFTTWDNRNLERVVGAPYSSLHDPHARKYMSQECIKEMLRKQKLINDNDEVLCTLREFNKYRNYLKTQYNDEVTRAVTAGDSSWKYEREQMQLINKIASNAEGRQAFLNSRRTNARQLQTATGQARTKKIEKNQQHVDKRLGQWQEEKAKENIRRIMVGFEKEQEQAERIFRLKWSRREARRTILRKATLKDIEVSQRRANDAKMIIRAIQKYKMDWIDHKLEYCKERIEKDKKVEKSMRAEITSKAQKRQRHVEHSRAMLPTQVEKRKEANKHLWEIVRKYAMRWLEKVRKRLSAPKDVLHESVWIGKSKGILDDTLQFLKELSGYEKMDDFVLNIIKLKRQIQQQIELEEAEEAAQEAERARRGETTSGESETEGEGYDEGARTSTGRETHSEFEDAVRNEIRKSRMAVHYVDEDEHDDKNRPSH